MATSARALPYVLSWAVLAALMIIGMNRMPLVLYTPIDGEWAKWNVEAILHFGKVFDLSPYSMLAGMGSMYFPNLPWLNPGALALALPLEDNAKNIVSYAVYAIELAASTVLLARAIGFSWLMATAAAQLYLYLLFPPFSQVFRIYDWYSLAPYFAHLTSVLNAASAVFLACGRIRDWRGNVGLSVGFLALFISGLLSAPFTRGGASDGDGDRSAGNRVAVDGGGDRGVGGGDHALRDAADLHDPAAKRSSHICGLGRRADRARECLDRDFVHGMQFGKSHCCLRESE
jgi:hypothetical protein